VYVTQVLSKLDGNQVIGKAI